MTREEASTILYKEWQRFLEDNLDYAGISDAYTMAINMLRQEPCFNCCNAKWIPVNKQLPKESGKYLVTFGGTHHIGIDFYSTEEDAKKIFEEPEEDIGWSSHNVIAWMPFPKPYKAESENEESCNNDGWCNTCEYKHQESECRGCVKYDEYGNLIALTKYKKESEE